MDDREAMLRLDERLREARERLDRLVALVESGAEPAPQRSSPARGGATEAATAPAEEPPRLPLGGHVLFLPSPGGYELVDRAGPPPSPGDVVESPETGGAYAVTKVGRSPLPGDDRPCAYLVEA